MADRPEIPTFENFYAGKAPWDIGRPQPTFVQVADQIRGSILDAGCGTGENALFFAKRGHDVVGIDYIAVPIERAKAKAQERGIRAEFEVADALALTSYPRSFDAVIDCGLFHVFADEDRAKYVAGLAHVLKADAAKPGGRLYLLCFSDGEPGEFGPRRVKEQELRDTFAQGWRIESIQPARFETNPEFTQVTFSAGGPKAWFMIAARM